MSELQENQIQLDSQKKSFLVHLELNRPEAANALNEPLITKLLATIKKFKKNSDIRALLLSGIGKHFCSGADLAWMKASSLKNDEQSLLESQTLAALFYELNQLPFPTLALVKGAAYGGGLGLIAACDYALCDSSARFSFSEIKLGLIPAVIWPYLKRKIPRTVLMRLALTGQVFTAEEAMKWGLVSDVFATAEFRHKVEEELRALLAASGQAQKSLKRLEQMLYPISSEIIAKSSQAICTVRKQEEAQEGMSAFFAKRKPAWKNTLPHNFFLI